MASKWVEKIKIRKKQTGWRHKTDRRQMKRALVEGEAENKLRLNTNMPFFVLNSWPTLFSVTHTVQLYTLPHTITMGTFA